ncbi:LuxR C-terminal-related transcriptional regulator [Kitasatospora sp. NPDC058218]|uniref:LuxR C-terminal-related transcriptional regulator n=1 Tax=Kitasatospora sp. NPDC058218 TaxID=3346385 RepID=UPI0036DD0071
MTTPPTAERPAGAPAAAHPTAHPTARPAAPADPPAPQGRPGKGRSGRGRAAKAANAARAARTPEPGGPAEGPTGGPPGGQDEALRLLRQLTPREAQALAQLAAGRDLAQSAAALGVTPATARSYQHRAMRKLGTRTHAEIAAFAALLSPAQAASASTAGPPDGPRPGTPAKPPAGRERRGRAKTRPTTPAAPATAAPKAPAAPATAAPHGSPRTGDGARPQSTHATPKAPARPDTPTNTTTASTPAAAGPAAAPAGAPRAKGGTTPRPGPATAPPPRPNGRGAATPAPTGAGTANAPAEQRGSARPAPAPVPAPAAHEQVPAPAPSFEELYETAHTRLVQQVFLLTACKHRAVHCVRLAFGEAGRRWEDVAAGSDPEGWVRARACEAALSPWHRGGPRRAHVWRLPHRRIKVRPADESQAVLPDHDRLTDRDRALLKALKRLSRPQRRALVLHDGLGLPAAAVAVEVESTRAAAEGRIWAARAALAQWVPELVGPDPAAEGFADRLAGLLHRAAVRGCPQPHRPPVPLLRARHGLANATRTGAAILITVAVGGAAAATLAGSGPGSLFRRPPEPPAQTVCGAVNGSAVPLVPDGPLTGIRSLWCSPAPGVEPVVMDPPPPRAPLWELPAAGRTTAALPPPGSAAGPSACTRWALHPCPADH